MGSKSCNFCTVESMKATAEARDVELIVKMEESGDMKGWVSARYSDKEEPSAYFMVLPESCAC